MNLKDFLTNRDKPPELYWSLVIEKNWVQAGIWYIGQTAAEVIDVSPGASWDTEDELVGACDTALSSCVNKLPENYTEPNKTVFGVSSAWVKDGEIQDEYLAKIKVVCTELSLTPVGFVVLPEAIAHLYKSEEQAPLNAIIIGLGSENLEISVFKLGILVGTTMVARSVSITEDVTEGLSRFEGAAPLPSRMIIFDGKGMELEDAKEELMKSDWEGNGKMKFLHTPKVETLASDRKVLATSLAGAAEIGNATVVVDKELKNEEETIPVEEESLPPESEIKNVTEPDEETSAADLGFVVGEDVTNSQIGQQKTEVPQQPDVEIQSPKPQMPLVQVSTAPRAAKNIFKSFSSRFVMKSPKISTNRSKTTIYIILVLILLVTIGGGIYWWFAPKAIVTIFVSPKSYQEQASIAFSTDGTFDESKAIIPAQAISSQASGDKTMSATGTKLIGNKATGSVQIANGNGDPINLPAGTILTSSAGLKFVTSIEASISGQLIPGSPGTATLSVTAGDVGAQYNLAKGEVFKVGAFDKSQVAATSQGDFSGGSSQQITAVSADDQSNLETSLKSELSGQATDALSGKVTNDQFLVNDLAGLDIASETFDHKVGDTADTLKLSLTVNATGIAADKVKLLQYVADTLKNKIPAGYALNSSQLNFKFTFTSKVNGLYVYTADISANFLPLTNSNTITREIIGKTVPDATNYLSSVPGYTRAEIDLKNYLPGPLKTLPHLSKNITIEVAPDQ
jgi:hypothetical protein